MAERTLQRTALFPREWPLQSVKGSTKKNVEPGLIQCWTYTSSASTLFTSRKPMHSCSMSLLMTDMPNMEIRHSSGFLNILDLGLWPPSREK
jgi:hypothetical protein